jgi:predicted transcriptional regulator
MDTPFEHMIFRPLSAEEQKQALDEARAQVAAGQVVPAEKVLAWLATWGTPDETPGPI